MKTESKMKPEVLSKAGEAELTPCSCGTSLEHLVTCASREIDFWQQEMLQ